MAKPLQPAARVSMRRNRPDRYPVLRALIYEQLIVAHIFQVNQPSSDSLLGNGGHHRGRTGDVNQID